jgi:hypothetical protein
MRIYTHEGLNADGTTTLRDLVTGIRSTVPRPQWLARWRRRALARPRASTTTSHLTASSFFTTPYIHHTRIEGAGLALACLERTLGAARRDARRSTAMLKYEGDWSE